MAEVPVVAKEEVLVVAKEEVLVVAKGEGEEEDSEEGEDLAAEEEKARLGGEKAGAARRGRQPLPAPPAPERRGPLTEPH